MNKASLRVDEGEFVFLVGASGSGKTTIIKLLTGEVRPSEGRVIVNNYDIGRMKSGRFRICAVHWALSIRISA